MKIVILSRGRAGAVTALQVFPSATLCVGVSEAHEYATSYPGVEIVTHPDDVVGLSRVRNWIADHFTDEVLVQVDDDVVRMVGLSDGYRVHYSTDDVLAVVETAAYCCKGAKASVFGFNGMPDVRKYSPLKPFAFNLRCDGVIGIIGRRHRWDEKLKLRDDVDFFLEVLRRDRIVWVDQRYSFEHKRFHGTGGNAVSRSAEQEAFELDYLHKKWGHWLSIRKIKTTTAPTYHVDR